MISKLIDIFKRYLIYPQIERKRMIGLSHFLNMRNKYFDIKTLDEIQYKIFSQNGEDGIIDFLLERLNIKKPSFIEIGVGDYTESNTRFIFETRSLRGLIIDCIPNFKNQVNKNIKTWRGELNIEETFISTENILEILKNNNFISTDILSIDIDGIDYWILSKLPKNFSKIVILEYNPTFGDRLEVTIPNIKNFNRTRYHYSNLCFGMSLRAAIKLMDNKNYYFIGTNELKNNAFFISKDFPKSEFFPNLIIEDLSNSTDASFRESRDIKGNLNYLSGKKKLQEISECEVVKLDNGDHKKVKIKDLFNLA